MVALTAPTDELDLDVLEFEIGAMRSAAGTGAAGVIPTLHDAEIALAIRHSKDPDRIFGSKPDPAPPDPIFGVKALYDADPRKPLAEVLKERSIDEIRPGDAKLLLAAGVVLREGKVPLLPEMRTVQASRVDAPHPYLPIAGDERFCRLMPELVLGADLAGLKRSEIATIQTAGGTHGLFSVGLYLKLQTETRHVFVSDPAWPNYDTIFSKVLELHAGTYPYYDSATHTTDLNCTLKAWEKLPANSAIVLQLCGHNPSGMDWSHDEWKAVAKFLSEKRPDLVVIMDAAYIGLARSLREDGFGSRALVAEGVSQFLVESDSKIMSGYGLRAGAASLVAPGKTEQAVRDALSVLAGIAVRGSISNAPDGAIGIGLILEDPVMRESWEKESLAGMREQMNGNRLLTVGQLGDRFAHLGRTLAMFGLLDLEPGPRAGIKTRGGLYLPGQQGRFNFGGVNNVSEIMFATNVIRDEVEA